MKDHSPIGEYSTNEAAREKNGDRVGEILADVVVKEDEQNLLEVPWYD